MSNSSVPEEAYWDKYLSTTKLEALYSSGTDFSHTSELAQRFHTAIIGQSRS